MIKNLYNFIITIPDRLFIFPSHISGKTVFFRKSYNYVHDTCTLKYGDAYHCTSLLIYREIFHFAGAILIILFSHFIFTKTGFKIFPIIILGLLTLWITFQEFYLHPTFYNQNLYKGIIDWLVWIVPIIIYFYIY